MLCRLGESKHCIMGKHPPSAPPVFRHYCCVKASHPSLELYSFFEKCQGELYRCADLNLQALVEDDMNKIETRRQSGEDMLVCLQNLPRIGRLSSCLSYTYQYKLSKTLKIINHQYGMIPAINDTDQGT